MDLLAHALYGATVCSETGLAGRRAGSPASDWYRDRSLWWALAFGVLPDAVSMWVPFAVHVAVGPEGIFFHHFGGVWLVVYRLMHNLIVPLVVSGILCVWRRRLFAPSLAWTLHVLCDAVSTTLYATDASIYEIQPIGVVRPIGLVESVRLGESVRPGGLTDRAVAQRPLNRGGRVEQHAGDLEDLRLRGEPRRERGHADRAHRIASSGLESAQL